MTLPPTFSRRQRLATVRTPDVYTYDSIPQKLRVQAVQIVREAIGDYGLASIEELYNRIHKFMCRELGVHHLISGEGYDKSLAIFRWMETHADVTEWLDCLEACLRTIELVRTNVPDSSTRARRLDAAISEINARMLEAAFGYQYVSGEIMRVDSQHLHQTVVLPALALLDDPMFAAANQEYRNAHEAYRHGRLEDCVVDCGKAFESVLKAIGTKRGWAITDKDPASKLVQAAVSAGFLASHSQPSLNHLSGLIGTSTPTIRNAMGGHGAGAAPRVVPQHLAAFQLHQTAAVIVYLGEQDASLP